MRLQLQKTVLFLFMAATLLGWAAYSDKEVPQKAAEQQNEDVDKASEKDKKQVRPPVVIIMTKEEAIQSRIDTAKWMFTHGEKYWAGLDVQQDFSESAKYFHKAAQEYYAALEMVPVPEKGVTWNPDAPVDVRETIGWNRKAAEQGDADAQYRLGYMYDCGGKIEEDMTEALKWYHKAAAQDHAYALYRLESLYTLGKGVPQDDVKAAEWCRKAAEQNLVDAQYELGQRYSWGLGVEKDYKEAATWYLKAAEQNHRDAQEDLAKMYKQGEGVPVNTGQAYKWLNIADVQFFNFYASDLDALAEDMTDKEIAEAERLTAEFLAGLVTKENEQ